MATPMHSSSSTRVKPLRLGLSLMVMLAVLAVGAFALSLWGEARVHGGPAEDPDLVEYVFDGDVWLGEEQEALDHHVLLESGLRLSTDAESELGIFFLSADLIRLNPETAIQITSVDLESTPMEVTLQLESGSIWVSTLQGVLDVSVETSQLRVTPESASTFIAYDEGQVEVFSAHHPTRVAFLSSADDSEGDDRVLNHYLLTESHKVSVRESKISSVLNQLRYTKLTKEFPFSYVDSEEWEDAWAIALESDQDRLTDGYTQFLSTLRRQGDAGHDADSLRYRLQELYRQVRSWLTLDEGHLMEIEESDDLAILYQALFLILEEDELTAIERLQQFESLAQDFESPEKLDTLVQIFQAVDYGSDFYPVKELLRDLRLQAADRRVSDGYSSDREVLELSLHFLRERLNEIYDLLDQGDSSQAQEALSDYNAAWQEVIDESGADLAEVVQTLTEERQILQNLLYRESSFYSPESYTVLSALEERILTLTAEEYDLNEERQAFIQDKIRILNRLVDLIDEGVVGIDEGSDLGQQLLDEAETMLSNITSQAAIVDYFISKVEELALMFEFIQSPDYWLQEGDFDQKFDAYLENQGDLDDLTEYIRGLTEVDTVDEVTVTLDEALADAEASFEGTGVSYLALLPLGDSDYRLFSIESGRVNGYDFEGNYDRVTGIVYDLVVEGQSFSSGVRLDDLYDTVEQAFSEETEMSSDAVDSEETQEDLSPVEELAVSLVKRTLEAETRMDFEEARVAVVDLDLNLFEIEVDVEADRNVVLKVTFQYEAEANVAFDVSVEVEGFVFEVDVDDVAELEVAVLDAWSALSDS